MRGTGEQSKGRERRSKRKVERRTKNDEVVRWEQSKDIEQLKEEDSGE